MELEELKNLWDKKNDSESNKLDDEEILPLLKKKTRDVFSQLNRSILISVGIIGIIITYYILVNLLVPQKYYDDIPYIHVFTSVEFILDAFFILIFFNFCWTYSKIRKIEIAEENLKSVLEKVVFALKTFKRSFYYGLFVFMPSLSLSFSYGMYYGVHIGLAERGLTIEELSFWKIVFIIFLCVLILILITGGVYLLSRLLFKKLFGNYLSLIEEDLNELKEKF